MTLICWCWRPMMFCSGMRPSGAISFALSMTLVRGSNQQSCNVKKAELVCETFSSESVPLVPLTNRDH